MYVRMHIHKICILIRDRLYNHILNMYIKIHTFHINISVNLNTTRVCSLPSYPGVDGRGPVVLSYLADQRVLAACGSWTNRDDQSCYQLSPDQPSGWQPLGEGQHINQFCTLPQRTRSHPLQDGWFLIGQKDNCGGEVLPSVQNY